MISNFWFIQLIGFVAGVFLLLSYFRSDTNKVLSFHIISGLLDFVHYFLLGAYSGSFVYLLESSRDYLYYKTKKDKYIFWVCAIVYLLISLFQIKTWYDYLPVLASLIDGYSLTLKKKYVTIGAIISYSIWVIYNVFVKSYPGIIFDGIIAFANLFIICYDLFKDKNKGKNL